MGKCWNCNKEITLKEEEVTCDSCGNVVNYRCWNCREWFSIYDDQTENKLEECKACGFFICPNCNSCGKECQKGTWKIIIKEILNDNSLNQDQKVQKICNLIEEIKLGKEQRCCARGVPISYAKSRIKSAIVKMKGFRTKNDDDTKAFSERFERILNIPLGDIITINQSRERGTYGQEFRDVFNYCLCEGILKKRKVKKTIDGEKIEFEAYKRSEDGPCPYLDLKNLIVKVCPNKNCKIKKYPLSQTECICPECRYKKGKNKGELRKLILKISNKDICQLNRNEFIKEEKNATSEPY